MSEALRGNLCCDGFRIKPFPRQGDSVRIDVGREDLKLDVAFGGCDRLPQQHGERVGFLARAASCDPDAQWLLDGMGAHQSGTMCFAR